MSAINGSDEARICIKHRMQDCLKCASEEKERPPQLVYLETLARAMKAESERDSLAVQVAQMGEALKVGPDGFRSDADWQAKAKTALSTAPTSAEKRVKAEKRIVEAAKAWMDTDNRVCTDTELAETDRALCEAVEALDALAQPSEGKG
jgi:hypothetical protein